MADSKPHLQVLSRLKQKTNLLSNAYDSMVIMMTHKTDSNDVEHSIDKEG